MTENTGRSLVDLLQLTILLSRCGETASGDAEVPVVITEGEFKTQALWRLAWHVLGHTAESPALLSIGLSGVWNWRGTIGKINDADGVRVDQKGPIGVAPTKYSLDAPSESNLQSTNLTAR